MRIDRLRRELSRRGIDTFIAIQNARYFSNTPAAEAVIVSKGEAILLCNRLELERVRRESPIKSVLAYTRVKIPLQRGEQVKFGELWELIAYCLNRMDARAVAFDSINPTLLRKLRLAHPASYLGLPELVSELRKIKSKSEIGWLRKSASLASKGMRCAAELMEVGRTELEIAAEIEYEMRRAGSEGTPFPTIVASGRNSWIPHATATRKKLRRGELVVVDIGATFNGYASDLTRTFALHSTRRQLRLLEVVNRAQEEALSLIRAGVGAREVDAAARKTIARAGYSKFSHHGTGHGIGLEIHEPPTLAPTSKDFLSKGMVLTVEPGVYIPKVGGARWEDMVLVKEDGYELLTHFNHSTELLSP